MGMPVKIMIEGQAVFLCCDGCKKSALANPKKTLATAAEWVQGKRNRPPVATASTGNSADEAKIQAELAKLSDADRQAAVAQNFCVVLEDNRLGLMGPPIKLMIDGQPVFLCCEGCKKKALADAKASLSKAAKLKAASAKR